MVADALSRLPVTEEAQINAVEDYLDAQQFDAEDMLHFIPIEQVKDKFAQQTHFSRGAKDSLQNCCLVKIYDSKMAFYIKRLK